MTPPEKYASPKRIFIFFRKDGFYPVELPEDTVADNAIANPGTLSVVDAITGKAVWVEESAPRGKSKGKTLRIFADPCLFDGSTWGHVATMEELTEAIRESIRAGVITQSETLNIRFRYLTDEEVENLTSI